MDGQPPRSVPELLPSRSNCFGHERSRSPGFETVALTFPDFSSGVRADYFIRNSANGLLQWRGRAGFAPDFRVADAVRYFNVENSGLMSERSQEVEGIHTKTQRTTDFTTEYTEDTEVQRDPPSPTFKNHFFFDFERRAPRRVRVSVSSVSSVVKNLFFVFFVSSR
jgi:hypothetical protein